MRCERAVAIRRDDVLFQQVRRALIPDGVCVISSCHAGTTGSRSLCSVWTGTPMRPLGV